MTSNPYAVTGRLLRLARLEAGRVVAYRFAAEVGMSPTHLSEIENCEVEPTLETILKICAAIPCDPHSIDSRLASVKPPKLTRRRKSDNPRP